MSVDVDRSAWPDITKGTFLKYFLSFGRTDLLKCKTFAIQHTTQQVLVQAL